MSFIPRENWNGLMDYEKKLHIGLSGTPTLLLAAVTIASHAEPVDMLEVVGNHHAALDLSEDSWQVYQQTP